MLYPPALLQRLKEAVSLSDLIGRYVPLVRRGKDVKACCPFHKEKTPSFNIKDEREYYHCFGCGAHGDHFTFLQRIEGLSFPESVERVAALAGISLPKPEVLTPEKREKIERQKDDYALLQAAADFFVAQLQVPAAAGVRDYIARRGLTAKTVKEFAIGYAPDGRTALKDHLLKAGFQESAMVEQGLVIRPDSGGAAYDRFRGRLMFPIQDKKGRVIAFGGRILGEGQPKYLNSPETPLFHKGEVLYNWHRARQAAHQQQRLVVVEGYMDVIALHQAGIGEAVAPLGTALGEAHLRQCWSVVREPVLCLDGDAAGLRAMERTCEVALPALKSGFGVGFAILPDGEDPDTLVKSGGKAAMEDRLAEAKPLSQMVWESYRKKWVRGEAATPEQKAALEEALEKLTAQLNDPKVQAYFRDYFRGQCRFGLRTDWGNVLAFRGRTMRSGARLTNPVAPAWERLLMGVILYYPKLLELAEVENFMFEESSIKKTFMFQQFSHCAMEGYLHKNLEGQDLRDFLSHQGLQHIVDLIEKDGAITWCQALWPDVEHVKAGTVWGRVKQELRRLNQELQIQEVVENVPSEITEDGWQRLVAQLHQHLESDE